MIGVTCFAANILDNRYIIFLSPAYAAVGNLHLVPVAVAVSDLHLCPLVQFEQRVAVPVGGCVHRCCSHHHDGFVTLQTFPFLAKSEGHGCYHQHQPYKTAVKSGFPCPEDAQEQKNSHADQHQQKEDDANHSPAIGVVEVSHSFEPLLQEESACLLNAVLRPVLCKTQVMPDVTITGIQQMGPFIVQEAFANWLSLK